MPAVALMSFNVFFTMTQRSVLNEALWVRTEQKILRLGRARKTWKTNSDAAPGLYSIPQLGQPLFLIYWTRYGAANRLVRVAVEFVVAVGNKCAAGEVDSVSVVCDTAVGNAAGAGHEGEAVRTT